MARYTPIKNSFVAGELSPRMDGRDDLDQYFQGGKLVENFIVLPHGGVMRRPGSRFAAETKDMAKATRLIDFIASVDQAYVVEFGHLYARFYANEGVIESSPGVPFEVVTPYTEDELADLHVAQDQDVMWVEHVDHPEYKLSRTSPTTFTFAEVVYRDGHAPMRPDNIDTATVTVTGAADPRTLTWSGSIGLASGNDVGRIVRVNSNEWYEIVGVTSGAIATANTMAGTTPVLSTATANWALGMFSDTEGARSVCFHEGRRAVLGSRGVPNWYALSQSNQFDNFLTGIEDDKAILKRLTAGKSDAIQWGVSGDEVMVVGTIGTEFRIKPSGDNILTPTSATSKPSTARGSEHIQPLAIDSEVLFIQRSGKKLRNLTYDLERDGRIARDVSILSEHILNDRVKELHYQQNSDSIVWCLLRTGKMVGFTYEREQKVNGGHRHVIGGAFGSGAAVVETMCVIPSPDGTYDQIWAVVKRTINGATKRYVEFFTKAFRPGLDRDATPAKRSAALEESVFSDCSLSLNAPKDISAITNANPAVFTVAAHGFSNGDSIKLRYIDSLAGDDSAPSLTTLNNIAFTVSSATANTFQALDQSGNAVNTAAMQAYIGSGKVYKEVTTIPGLDHLEGQVVAVQVDGAAHPARTVTGGAVTLDSPASIVHVGLGYTSRCETMRWVGGGRIGTDQGKPQRIQRLVARVLETVGGYWRQGRNADKELEFVPPHSDDEASDTAPPFISGDIELSPTGGWDEEPTVYFEQPEPLPMTVLALMIWGDSRER